VIEQSAQIIAYFLTKASGRKAINRLSGAASLRRRTITVQINLTFRKHLLH
jgi:hypothetical protein